MSVYPFVCLCARPFVCVSISQGVPRLKVHPSASPTVFVVHACLAHALVCSGWLCELCLWGWQALLINRLRCLGSGVRRKIWRCLKTHAPVRIRCNLMELQKKCLVGEGCSACTVILPSVTVLILVSLGKYLGRLKLGSWLFAFQILYDTIFLFCKPRNSHSSVGKMYPFSLHTDIYWLMRLTSLASWNKLNSAVISLLQSNDK